MPDGYRKTITLEAIYYFVITYSIDIEKKNSYNFITHLFPGICNLGDS